MTSLPSRSCRSAAPGARGPGRGHDHDVVRLDEAGGRERGQRDDRRGGVAAGIGDPRGGLRSAPGRRAAPAGPWPSVPACGRLVVPGPAPASASRKSGPRSTIRTCVAELGRGRAPTARPEGPGTPGRSRSLPPRPRRRSSGRPATARQRDGDARRPRAGRRCCPRSPRPAPDRDGRRAAAAAHHPRTRWRPRPPPARPSAHQPHVFAARELPPRSPRTRRHSEHSLLNYYAFS